MNVETDCSLAYGVTFDATLQLSHIHMNVETCRIRHRLLKAYVASIEPHSYECGNTKTAQLRVQQTRFN